MSATQAEFRRAMGCFATGVTVITVDYDGAVHGMTANAFTSVSLDPLLVLVCVDHKARTHAHLHSKKRFGVNVLAEDQRNISQYYARPGDTHQHAEQDAAGEERRREDRRGAGQQSGGRAPGHEPGHAAAPHAERAALAFLQHDDADQRQRDQDMDDKQQDAHGAGGVAGALAAKMAPAPELAPVPVVVRLD